MADNEATNATQRYTTLHNGTARVKVGSSGVRVTTLIPFFPQHQQLLACKSRVAVVLNWWLV
jgi:hypothetical protein